MFFWAFPAFLAAFPEVVGGMFVEFSGHEVLDRENVLRMKEKASKICFYVEISQATAAPRNAAFSLDVLFQPMACVFSIGSLTASKKPDLQTIG